MLSFFSIFPFFSYLHGSSNRSNVAPFAATLRHGGQTLPNIQKMFSAFPYARKAPRPRLGTRASRARPQVPSPEEQEEEEEPWPAFRHRSLTSATRAENRSLCHGGKRARAAIRFQPLVITEKI